MQPPFPSVTVNLSISFQFPSIQTFESTMKAFILALCIAVASAGIVEHTRCGGLGTFRQLRVSGCEGAQCNMQPGTPYAVEGDLIPATSSPSLTLKVTAVYLGFPITVVEMVLPDSSVQQGQLYIIKFTITPNDLLSGNTLPINAECSKTEDRPFIEACVGMVARIL